MGCKILICQTNLVCCLCILNCPKHCTPPTHGLEGHSQHGKIGISLCALYMRDLCRRVFLHLHLHLCIIAHVYRLQIAQVFNLQIVDLFVSPKLPPEQHCCWVNDGNGLDLSEQFHLLKI